MCAISITLMSHVYLLPNTETQLDVGQQGHHRVVSRDCFCWLFRIFGQQIDSLLLPGVIWNQFHVLLLLAGQSIYGQWVIPKVLPHILWFSPDYRTGPFGSRLIKYRWLNEEQLRRASNPVGRQQIDHGVHIVSELILKEMCDYGWVGVGGYHIFHP